MPRRRPWINVSRPWFVPGRVCGCGAPVCGDGTARAPWGPVIHGVQEKTHPRGDLALANRSTPRVARDLPLTCGTFPPLISEVHPMKRVILLLFGLALVGLLVPRTPASSRRSSRSWRKS